MSLSGSGAAAAVALLLACESHAHPSVEKEKPNEFWHLLALHPDDEGVLSLTHTKSDDQDLDICQYQIGQDLDTCDEYEWREKREGGGWKRKEERESTGVGKEGRKLN
ncbi:hypothetical protein PanWU01x14_146490 [Parasponia andersonii]|uniref:Uncharacterized protein n=1 Tax=Parasponia andersonii TaxID=3476 RepID=A0A2P5CJS4_PARAD|nr:hypothetical protein PanWU01x14_146490 [Parasponia andersonii]